MIHEPISVTWAKLYLKKTKKNQNWTKKLLIISYVGTATKRRSCEGWGDSSEKGVMAAVSVTGTRTTTAVLYLPLSVSVTVQLSRYAVTWCDSVWVRLRVRFHDDVTYLSIRPPVCHLVAVIKTNPLDRLSLTLTSSHAGLPENHEMQWILEKDVHETYCIW